MTNYGAYYASYYKDRKHIYKERYEEQKRLKLLNKERFKDYEDEADYYKKQLEKWGVKSYPINKS